MADPLTTAAKTTVKQDMFSTTHDEAAAVQISNQSRTIVVDLDSDYSDWEVSHSKQSANLDGNLSPLSRQSCDEIPSNPATFSARDELRNFVCETCKKECPVAFQVKMCNSDDPRCIECRAPKCIATRELAQKFLAYNGDPSQLISEKIDQYYRKWAVQVDKRGFHISEHVLQRLRDKAQIEVTKLLPPESRSDLATIHNKNYVVPQTLVNDGARMTLRSHHFQTAETRLPSKDNGLRKFDLEFSSNTRFSKPTGTRNKTGSTSSKIAIIQGKRIQRNACSSKFAKDIFKCWMAGVSTEKKWIAPKVFDDIAAKARVHIAGLESLASQIKRKRDAEEKRYEEDEW